MENFCTTHAMIVPFNGNAYTADTYQYLAYSVSFPKDFMLQTHIQLLCNVMFEWFNDFMVTDKSK